MKEKVPGNNNFLRVSNCHFAEKENISEKEELQYADERENGQHEEKHESETKELTTNNNTYKPIKRHRVKNNERSIVSTSEMDMSVIKDKINE